MALSMLSQNILLCLFRELLLKIFPSSENGMQGLYAAWLTLMVPMARGRPPRSAKT